MGNVFNIQKFSINDGPGIRTTVFLKGCPLRCAWCHNPESQSVCNEVFYDSRRCISCGACIAVCPTGAHSVTDGIHTFDRTVCKGCLKCTEACVSNALEAVGSSMTASEVIDEVLKDKAFYETSGGGMTLSGGEPLMQFDFALELLRLAKAEGLHTCIETSGFCETEKILEISEYVDVFLYDWKITDSAIHKRYIGADNSLILKNLQALDKVSAKIILRCPIIPDVNNSDEHLMGIAKLANSLENIIGIELEPYHSLGVSKCERLGKNDCCDKFEMPDENEVNNWLSRINNNTNVPVKRA